MNRYNEIARDDVSRIENDRRFRGVRADAAEGFSLGLRYFLRIALKEIAFPHFKKAGESAGTMLDDKKWDDVYRTFRAIYDGEVDKKSALAELCERDKSLKKSTYAQIYDSFKRILDGQAYKRVAPISATVYFLRQIAVDFGPKILKRSLEAVCEHIRYLRRIYGTPSNALRAECRKIADEFGCDVDFSDAIFAGIDAAPDSDAEDESANNVRYWIYAPGAQATYWDENLRDGPMGLGWHEVGDVRAFESKKELRLKLVSTNPDSNSDQSNAANTLWKFANVMRPGEVVYAKKGAKKIIGRGVVRSDYRFAAADSTTSRLRRIDRTPGEVDVPPSNRYFVTLQDVTKYVDVVSPFEDAFEIAPPEPTRTICEPYSADDFLNEVFLDKERYDDLVGVLRRKKNVVIQGAPDVGKSFCANRLA